MIALKRMTYFLRPYRLMVVLMLATTVLPVAMELLVPRLLQYVIDEGIRPRNLNAIYWGSALLFGTALLGTIATLGQGVARAQISQGTAFDMRNVLFAHIQSLSYANLDQLQTGQLMTRISSDVDTVRMFSSAGLALLLRALLMVGGSMVMLFVTDWELAAIMLVLLLIMGVILRTLLQRAQPLFKLVQQRLAALNTIVQENLAGVRVVKAYVRERYEIDRFARGNIDYRDENVRVGRLMALALPTLALLTNLGTVAILWWGGRSVIGDRLSVGELIAFNNYLLIGMAPLLLLSNILMMVSRAEASAQRFFEVLDTSPRIQKVAQPFRGASAHKHAVQGKVVFNKVSFHYERLLDEGVTPDRSAAVISAHSHENGAVTSGKQTNQPRPALYQGHHNGTPHTNGTSRDEGNVKDVLHEVSFVVAPGQQVALLGATGSGKSTLINLIPRYYDVTGGAVEIDGVDVRQWAPEVLRRQIGMVLQETTLFSGTIRANIAYGRPDATLAEVEAAAQAAQAHDFIMAMASGYDSQVEARGANLSGGQKQRIAIARALLVDPAILVLDDSTSAVDFETEVRLQAALDVLMAGRTTFIVAQRISSVLKADQIMVLEHGQIAARGTHRELLASSPIYQEIYYSQLGADALTAVNGKLG